MSNELHSPDQDLRKKIKFQGIPNNLKDSRNGFWDTCGRFLSNVTKGRFGFGFGGFNLDGEFAVDDPEKKISEIDKIRADTVKTVNEALKIKEELEQDHQDRKIDRQIKVNKAISEIFADKNTPPSVKAMQLCGLLNAFPELKEQIEIILSKAANMKMDHGAEIQLLFGENSLDVTAEWRDPGNDD